MNGSPSAMFIQPITIKTVNTAGFVANLSLLDSIRTGTDSARVLLKAYTPDITLVKGAPVTYFIGDRSHPLKTGKVNTDNFGEAKISIPLKEITNENNILQAEIKNGKEIKTFSIKLPVFKKETIVRFYPQGGHLVNSAKNIVGWEVTSNEGEPLMATADLYQNDQVVQAIQTDAYGIGNFSLTPQPGHRYYVKLRNIETNDTTYTLPVALLKGPVINITQALASDTLNILINNNEPGNKWVIMVHNYRTVYVTASIVPKAFTTAVKVFLGDVPRGLNTFTLLDTLGRPLAERLFFAHFDKKAIVNIFTDSTSYSTRQKVSLRFSISDAEQKALTSLVSVACVQDNRFDVRKMTDIESYVYLKFELNLLPFKNKTLSDDALNKEYLENILLVRGWRRYTWQDIANVKAEDTLQDRTSLTFGGFTLLNNKPLKKPVQLNLKKFIAEKTSTLEFLSTDSIGRFRLTLDNLLSEPNRQLQLSVNNRLQEQYVLRMNDPYKEMNKNLAGTLVPGNYNIKSFTQTSQSVVLKSEEGGKKLADVIVRAKQDNSIYAGRGANACGDYVCMYGILNCANHPYDGYQPVVGRRYGQRGGGVVVYVGCESLQQEIKKEYLLSLDGIYSKKDFYLMDFSTADRSDPQYLSTIYWNHAIFTDADGNGKTTFYTSDIPGKFRIVVQGLTNNGVVFGEQYFDVKKPIN